MPTPHPQPPCLLGWVFPTSITTFCVMGTDFVPESVLSTLEALWL